MHTVTAGLEFGKSADPYGRNNSLVTIKQLGRISGTDQPSPYRLARSPSSTIASCFPQRRTRAWIGRRSGRGAAPGFLRSRTLPNDSTHTHSRRPAPSEYGFETSGRLGRSWCHLLSSDPSHRTPRPSRRELCLLRRIAV